MSIVLSGILYFSIIIISSYSFNLATKTKKKSSRNFLLSVAIIIPVFFAGFRYSTGTDYFSYINGFERIKFGYSVRWGNFEYSYFYLNSFLAKVGFDSSGILIATSLIMMVFITKSLIKRKDIGIVAFGFLTFMFMFYQSSYNIVRLMIAISIFLYNISNIENKNPGKYLIFTIIAASFHISAISTIPLYWFFNIFKMDKSVIRRLLLYFCVGIIIILFGSILEWIISTFNLEYLSYYKKYATGEGGSFSLAFKRFVLYFPLVLPGLFNYKVFRELDKSFSIYYSLLCIGLIIKILATFQTTYIDRLADFFIIASVMVIPVYMREFSRKKNYFLYITVLAYLVVFWVYVYFVIKNHGTVPYQWIF